MSLSTIHTRARDPQDVAHGPLPLPGRALWSAHDYAARDLRMKLLLIDHMHNHAAALRIRADYAEAKATNELAWALDCQGRAQDIGERHAAAEREQRAAALFAEVSSLRERAAEIEASWQLRHAIADVARAA